MAAATNKQQLASRPLALIIGILILRKSERTPGG
jgi:hypothetical protein